LRSGAKIGSLQTNFQAFCSYLFHFGHNSLEGWEIIFGKQSPGAEFKGQMAGILPRLHAAGSAVLNGLPNA